MQPEQRHHEELIKGIAEQFEPVLGKSRQAIYIYLDDTHKVCNKKMADLLGYKSPEEWAQNEAALADVVEEDQPAVVGAYGNASEKLVASNLDVRVKHTSTGKIIKTKMIMVPVGYAGHVFVMHFLTRV